MLTCNVGAHEIADYLGRVSIGALSGFEKLILEVFFNADSHGCGTHRVAPFMADRGVGLACLCPYELLPETIVNWPEVIHR